MSEAKQISSWDALCMFGVEKPGQENKECVTDICTSDAMARFKTNLWNNLQKAISESDGPIKCGGQTFDRIGTIKCLMEVFCKLEEMCKTNRKEAFHVISSPSVPCGADPCKRIHLKKHFLNGHDHGTVW